MSEGLWPEMYLAVQAFWAIINPVIEKMAQTWNIPVDLYYFGELGLHHFSHADFRERDRFSNPQIFEELFLRLSASGWITQVTPHRYEVTQEARESARRITQAGYNHLAALPLLPNQEEKYLAELLEKIVQACFDTPEPPRKRALLRRFRVATQKSPPIVRIREHLMDLFAYRDDVHLAAWEAYPVTGLMWNTFSLLWSEDATSASAMAELMSFRGFEAEHYQQALEDLREIGWVEKRISDGSFRVTKRGQELRNKVEIKTDTNFYQPWAILSKGETQDLGKLISKLNTNLSSHSAER